MSVEDKNSRYDVTRLKDILEEYYQKHLEEKQYERRGHGNMVHEKLREKKLELDMIDEMQEQADKADAILEYYRTMTGKRNGKGITFKEVRDFAIFCGDVMEGEVKGDEEDGR